MNGIEQRTEAWFQERIGCLTASKFNDATATIKSAAFTAAREKLIWQLVVERLTGVKQESGFVSVAMQRGIDCEPLALIAYENLTGELASTCGFIKHPNIDWLGASPDGIVASGGVLEIKCPNTETHLKTLISKEIAPEYQAQMLCQMLCSGCTWGDFVSFDDRLPEAMRLVVIRFTPTPEQLAKAEQDAKLFLVAVDSLLQTAIKS